MHWIKRKKSELNSINRYKEKIDNPTNSRLKSISGRTGSFIATIVAATIGTTFSSMIAINYLERYKAEESIRNLALIQLYQPFKEKINRCHEKMTETIKNAGIIDNTNELALNYFKIASNSPNEARDLGSNSEILAIFSGMIKEYNEASGAMNLSRLEAIACERTVEFSGHELATVLNLNSKYEEIISKYQKLKNSQPETSTNSNLFFHIIKNPETAQSLIKGFNDARNGYESRGLATFDKIHSELKKSKKSSSAEFQYFSNELRRSQSFDKDVTELFLRELRARFEKLPEFSPTKVFSDLTQPK